MTTPRRSGRGWTTPADVRAKVRRRWDDGTLLSALAAGQPFPLMDVPLRGPGAGELGERLDEARDWIAQVEDGAHHGRHYEVEYAAIGGRHFGRNQIPARARIATYEQAWALLGVAREAAAYARILDATAGLPTVRAWVAANPLKALTADPDWPTLVAAYRWLDDARGSGRYLREISAPGVDTKFVERHRPMLSRLLDVPGTATGFVAALGLRAKPETVRLRCAPGVLGLPGPLTEATVRVGELAALQVKIDTAVIIENETTYLTVPIPPGGVVIWGKGFEVDRAGSLPWLADATVWYWGDLDTHGFAILNRLRAWLPQTQSFLMDRRTLLAHRDRWVREPTPAQHRLGRLDHDEEALYSDLVSARLGESVRLEQERLDWGWVEDHLPYQEAAPPQ